MNMDHLPESARERLIRSGELEQLDAVRECRSEMFGNVLVERATWDQVEEPQRLCDTVITAVGYIWFRFWLPEDDVIVEKYFDQQGNAVGMLARVCMPLVFDQGQYITVNLLLEIFMGQGGQVFVLGEEEFERHLAEDRLTEEEAQRAEAHLRHLTGVIAQGKFPPAFVRNWELDRNKLQKGENEASSAT